MNKNMKKLFLLTTVLMILLTISAIDAAEVNDDTIIDDASLSSQDIIQNSVSDTISDTGDNKEITKKDITNDRVTKSAATHVVTNDNVDEIFGGDGYNLSDTVNEGDTLDFQGLIDKEHSLIINKPVNVITSTKDAVISLHSVGGDYSSSDPGKAFIVNVGASGSNVTGLYLNNTQFWVHSAQDVYFKNMSMIVKDARVGTGVGQTSIRYSNHITLDGCHIYTENNGGSTSVCFTLSANCTIKNSVIEGFGNVGNIITLANPFNIGDAPEQYQDLFAPQIMQLGVATNMSLLNCTVNTPNGGGISNVLQYPTPNSRIENCVFNATGSTINCGVNGTCINNTLINGVSLSIPANATAYGNVNTESTTTIGSGAQVYNNTFGQVTINGANVNFTDNTVKTATSPAITVGNKATNAQITNNYIVAGDVTGNDAVSVDSAVADSVTVSGNGPVIVTITDDTYSNFFNEDGTIIEGAIPENSEAQFNGMFTNRKFVISVPITITTGSDQAIFDGCAITTNSPTTVKNVIFIGGDSTSTINAVQNVTFENVTFDGVKATGASMIDPSARANITFIGCTVNDFEGNSIVRGNGKKTGVSITVIDSEFRKNNAAFSMFCENGNSWKINLTNSNFTDNIGQNGGVIQGMSTGTTLNLNIDNCIFEGNTATGKAGVIYATSNNEVISISNSVFRNNEVIASTSGGTAVNDLAGVLCISNGNTDLTLSNNIMTDNTAANGTDIYFEAMNNVIHTDAKLIAENASTEKDQNVDITVKLTDDMGNLIGFKSGLFGYSTTIKDDTIMSNANGITTKTINATYYGGTYPIALEVTAGADKFDSLEIINGELEVIGPAEPVILTDETWDQFFNEDGTIKEDVVEAGSDLEFHGTFTNRNMTINIPLTITTGETQAVFDGCTFTLNTDAIIQNVKFTGALADSTPMIISKANTVFENVTFDEVQTNYAEMIRATANSNITIKNSTIENFKGGALIGPSATGQARIGLDITDSVFNNNNATWIPIRINSNYWNVNIKNSNFTNNAGTTGGVIAVMSGRNYNTVHIDKCVFSDNMGTGKSGVLYVMGNNANVSVTNSNFTNNGVQSSGSGGSSATELAGAITIGNGNTNLVLENNIMSGSIAENGTDIYFELTSAGTGKIYTDAKLIAENASTDKDQFVDLKFKLTDDMGNIIGFKAGNIFNYSVTLNDEEISYVDTLLYGRIYGFSGIANKTINATYPGGLYPITLSLTAGADKFDSIEIVNGQLEVIAPKQTPTINYEVINDVEGKVAIEFSVLDEDGNEISPAELILSDGITATANTNKVYKNTELTAGEYAVNVKFEETDDYQEATLDFTLTVKKDPQTIIDELNQSLIANETALNNTLEEIAALEQENNNLKEQVENLTSELNNTQAALTEAQAALENATETITQLEQNITTLTQELNDTQTALTEAEAAKAQLEEENANLTTKVAQLEEALANNQTALQEAQETISELNDNITALETELNNTQQALTEAQETITQINNNITTLEEELAEAQRALNESEEENANLTAKVAELEEALAANQTALEEAENTITELNDNITALETQLNTTQQALTEAQETITELNENITSLEEELNQTESELADTQQALADANDEIESLNDEIDALEEELEQTESELADTQQALDEANEEIEELEYKVSELELALNLTENALDKVIDALEELNKPKETSISIDPITDAKYGDEINITGLLVNEDAIGLANQPVTITFNGEEIEQTTRNGEFTYTTTANIVGENTVTVTYAGSDKYTESTATYTFEVAKADTYINITEIETVKKGEVTSIAGILYDGNGNALANKVVRLLVNSGRKTVRTNDMGEYSFDYTTTKVGNITVTATYDGNDLYEATTTETQFEVNKLSTIITIDPIESVIKGTQTTITGTLTDENGNAIANAQVKININGSPKTLKTDSEGRFTHTYTFGKVGENTITATYAGNTNYDETEVQTIVEVTKAQAVITLDDIESVNKGESATFTGKLTNAEGKAIANAQVKLNINGSQKTLTTDADGAFTHTFKMIKEGTNNITATFNGNNDFTQATTNSTIEVIKAE